MDPMSLRRLNISLPGDWKDGFLRQSSTANSIIDQATLDVYVFYMTGKQFGIQGYPSSSLNFSNSGQFVAAQTQNTTEMFGELADYPNPHIILSWIATNRIAIGIFQHELTTSRGWFIGEVDISGIPTFVNSKSSYQTASSIIYHPSIGFRLQNYTYITYYDINLTLYRQSSIITTEASLHTLYFTVSAIDPADNSTYHIYQEPDPV